MEKIVLKATRRDVLGKQVKALRREGKLPAILYGRHIEPVSVLMDLRETSRLLSQAAPSALITIDLDGEQHVALVREKQRNNLTGSLIHLDFQVVSMQEKLRTHVVLEFVGEAPALKMYNGILVEDMNELEVESLPGDLPERILVDVSVMKKIGDTIYVRDIKMSDKVKLLADPDAIVAVMTGMAAEEVDEYAPAEPEVIEKGKKEEEDF